MLDETTPADQSANTPETGSESGSGTAKKAAAKRAPAKKTAAKRTTKKAAASTAATDPAQEQPAAEGAAAEEAPAAKKAPAKRTRKAPAKKASEAPATEAPAAEAAPATEDSVESADEAPAKPARARKTATKKTAAKKTTTRKSTAKPAADEQPAAADEQPAAADEQPAAATVAEAAAEGAAQPDAAAEAKAPAKKTAAKRTRKTAAKKAAAPAPEVAPEVGAEPGEVAASADDVDASGTLPLFQAPEAAKKPARRTRKRAAAPVEETPVEAPVEEPEAAEALADEVEADVLAEAAVVATEELAVESEVAEEAVAAEEEAAESTDATDATDASDTDADADATETEEGEDEEGTPTRRRRRRGGRRRRKSAQAEGEEAAEPTAEAEDEAPAEGEAAAETAEAEGTSDEAGEGSGSTSRRRRRRRRAGDTDGTASDDPENTVVRVRETRKAEDQITAVTGSTRLEAKKQRRREGREAGRRRAPIVSEAEFLARREAVDRVMVIRQRPDLTQIAVLEDKVLVEHYVARESQTSLIGNVYLGRVQNVLPSMEAAFVDIGKGRNAVLYAGEVNWSALGHKDGQPRKIESVLSPGQPVLVQVTKDPVGHKGARLTSQISLAGRFLVYVPDGTTSGISRKLPDTERARLKSLLKEIVPDSAGVIVRTAAEGASEEELTRDVERLKARWEDIELKARDKGKGAQLLYGEPDLTLKVVRDLFTEDFSKLVIEGDDAWNTVQGYVQHVAPDLAERLEKYAPADTASAVQGDVFTAYRIDEQIAKGLDRKVWLPSGGSLIIDRTEAMTVVDVNTGKFTGSGGNLEETVTKNNLEAAEEIVRQLRLRDIGGIIVVDFIDMVLESNRDLVLRRLVECLGRDRTRHQVAEVTSLGLVQMTRKRIGTGLLEAFSTECEHCHGRGLVTHTHPVDQKSGGHEEEGRRGRRNRGKGDKQQSEKPAEVAVEKAQAEKDQPEPDQQVPAAEQAGEQPGEQAGEQEQQPSRRSRSRGRSRNRGARQEQQADESAAPESPALAEPAAAADPVPALVEAEELSELEPAPVEEVAELEPAPVEEVAELEPVVQEPVAGAPTVVTRTRSRRGASRPTTTATPVTPAPVAAPVVVVPAAAAEPSAESRPKVVTRTRGRAATRPSGAPEEVVAPDEAVAPSESQGSEAGDESTAQHVPVKKKGTRKR